MYTYAYFSTKSKSVIKNSSNFLLYKLSHKFIIIFSFKKKINNHSSKGIEQRHIQTTYIIIMISVTRLFI